MTRTEERLENADSMKYYSVIWLKHGNDVKTATNVRRRYLPLAQILHAKFEYTCQFISSMSKIQETPKTTVAFQGIPVHYIHPYRSANFRHIMLHKN